LDNFITIVEIEIVWSRLPETVGQAHMQSHFTKITKKLLYLPVKFPRLSDLYCTAWWCHQSSNPVHEFF